MAMLIRYANYLVLAETDLEVHFLNKLIEKTDEFTLRSRTDLKQIDGAQWQLISYKVRKVLLLVTGATVSLLFYFRDN